MTLSLLSFIAPDIRRRAINVFYGLIGLFSILIYAGDMISLHIGVKLRMDEFMMGVVGTGSQSDRKVNPSTSGVLAQVRGQAQGPLPVYGLPTSSGKDGQHIVKQESSEVTL